MGILQRILARCGVARTPDRKDDWPSTVLLLKAPLFPTPEEAVATGQEAWGAHAPVKLMSLANDGKSYILTCGTFVFSLHLSSERYGVVGQEPSEAQQRPWDEHQAWFSIDAPTAKVEKLRQDKTVGDVYKLLLVYAFKRWSSNCLGIYFPAESVTVPNLGDLAQSIQWGRKNGIDLSFLD
jgi:hypothetical protein